MENKVPVALQILKEALKDPGYYSSWKANIAMAFQDELDRKGYKFPDMHKISNDAARNFIRSLVGDLHGK